ncbi:MAG: hypothetical protein NXI24_09350 [bacterium]|nr:hypothetical protein [bacterium]
MYFLIAALGLLVPSTLLAPPEAPGLDLRFLLQEVSVDRDSRERLQSFIARNPVRDPYFLVQGFACDTGGYGVSVRVARQRGASVARELLSALNDTNRPAAVRIVREADPAVQHGQGREQFRRAEIQVFRSAVDRDRALVAANQAAADWNAAARAALNQNQSGTEQPGELADARAGGRELHYLYFLFGLLLVLLAIGLIWLYAGRREDPERHRLSAEEGEAMEVLTGGAVTPLPATEEDRSNSGDSDEAEDTGRAKAKSRSKAGVGGTAAEAGLRAASGPTPASRSRAAEGRLNNFIDRARNQTMGVKKKSKTKITPISIRGAVDRDFEDNSLAELSRAPIHALEGLTPRHARMMEEAFGVKTVEDLARLKYVEIARAIVVLSRYEK